MQPLNLRGMTFGNRKVIARAPNNGSGKSRWYVRCSCGDVSTVYGRHLLAGWADQCSDCGRTRIGAGRYLDLIGQTIGMRTVLAKSSRRGNAIYLDVRCECGFVSSVRATQLLARKADACSACANATYRNTYSPPRRSSLLCEAVA